MCLHSCARQPTVRTHGSADDDSASTAHDALHRSPPMAARQSAATSLSPYLTGGGALLALFLLLWITTRFNRDR